MAQEVRSTRGLTTVSDLFFHQAVMFFHGEASVRKPVIKRELYPFDGRTVHGNSKSYALSLHLTARK